VYGSIMVHVDPLALIKNTYLACFGEIGQKNLLRSLKAFLNALN
jgi:hypothetical protein